MLNHRRDAETRRRTAALSALSRFLPSSMTARIDAKPGGAGFSLRGTLVPPSRWRTEVRRRLKSAPQEHFYAVTILVCFSASRRLCAENLIVVNLCPLTN